MATTAGTAAPTAAQVDYATSLIAQLQQNLTVVSDKDRRWVAERKIDWAEHKHRCLALGYESIREVPAETKAEVKEAMIQERLTGTEALARITREDIEAMTRAEVSALIDTLKGRPW